MASTNPTGKAILRASLALFRQDRQMIWLPVMAAVTGLIAFAIVAVPLALAIGHTGLAFLVAFACGTLVATAATVIFNVALVFAANDRIEGRTPTITSSLAQAWGRKGVIFRWAILAAVVGTAIRALETRLGVVGRIVGFAGGLAWAVATFLVIPVLAFEDVGPIEAVKRSSHVLKAQFGNVVRSGLRFGLLFLGWNLAALAVIAHRRVPDREARLPRRRAPRGHRDRRVDRRCHVRVGGRDVHAHDPLPLCHWQADPRPRRQRGRGIRQPARLSSERTAREQRAKSQR